MKIRRTALVNGGKPLGTARFQKETGITPSDWRGKLWARWGDALVEAGYSRNDLQGPRTDDDLLENLANLVQELGHFPTTIEIRLKAHNSPGFPWHNSYSRFGSKQKLVVRLRDFCLKAGNQVVLRICDTIVSKPGDAAEHDAVPTDEADADNGYVYLMKSGRYYKVRPHKCGGPS